MCVESESINIAGTDRGLITFFAKYLDEKHVDEIFGKFHVECIQNTDDLTQILALCILIFKVKAFQIANIGEGESRNEGKTRILKKDFKPIAAYLSIWIVSNFGNHRNHDDEVYDIQITKENFTKNMQNYLKRFVEEHDEF